MTSLHAIQAASTSANTRVTAVHGAERRLYRVVEQLRATVGKAAENHHGEQPHLHYDFAAVTRALAHYRDVVHECFDLVSHDYDQVHTGSAPNA